MTVQDIPVISPNFCWRVIDSQKTFLAGDETLVVEYRKAYGVAAATETFDTDRWFAPSEFKIAVEGISLDSVSAGIGNSEKAIACNGEVEVWTGHDEARDVFVLVRLGVGYEGTVLHLLDYCYVTTSNHDSVNMEGPTASHVASPLNILTVLVSF